MAAPVPLRSDFDAQALRALAKGLRDPAQTRRLLALSAISALGYRSPVVYEYETQLEPLPETLLSQAH